MTGSVVVETAARLHFGVLDLRGSTGRWFGGIGAAAPGPRLKVSVRRAPTLEAVGPDAERAASFAGRFLAAHGLGDGARVEVHRALPAHAGLGSGTQLALAVAAALAGLFDVPARAPELARAVGRTRRSAVGTWTFEGGGLVVEAGRRQADASSPLVARLPFPRRWECVVAIPHTASPLSGDDEEAAFTHLPEPSLAETHEVAHLVLMSLLPAVVERDIAAFGQALTRIQEITGGWFAGAQGGGAYRVGPTERVIQRMKALDVPGVGQSSWGPAAYAIVDGADAAARVEADLASLLGQEGVIFRGTFPREGARIWREG